MSLSKPRAVPKPKRFKTSRRTREEAKKGKAFRDAIWLRDDSICKHCLARLRRFGSGDFGQWVTRSGHVHHLRGRNVAPEDRYNPEAAVLLCASCHRAVHDGRLTLKGSG